MGVNRGHGDRIHTSSGSPARNLGNRFQPLRLLQQLSCIPNDQQAATSGLLKRLNFMCICQAFVLVTLYGRDPSLEMKKERSANWIDHLNSEHGPH